MPVPIPPLEATAIFRLLLQLGLLLAATRAGAEIVRRFGMPAVVGELAGGIILGPTVFGYVSPGLFASVFPPDIAQWHLLETVSVLGLVFLLLLTGLETDLKLVRSTGRAAFMVSVTGMLLPFASGFALGAAIPDRYLAQPEQRLLFSLFLATALAISAMPVIAKILIDLDLTKRNIGVAILSAGVIDDTAGWLILSLIAGAASTGSFLVGEFIWILVWLVLFILSAGLLLHPLMRFLVRFAGRHGKAAYSDLVLLVFVTLLCAAATERIGVHAFFGAFVAGVVFRQVPLVRKETVHQLEAFTLAVLAPVFLGSVGLRVDLWSLRQGSIFLLVLAVACFGKIVGALIGGRWGGLRFWEAMAIALAMNARGAMGLVVATIGLSLGILTSQMFTILIAMAMVTSLMAPPGLRFAMSRVRISDEEAQRILAEETRGILDLRSVRVLVAADGTPNSDEALRIAQELAASSEHAVEAITVVQPIRPWERIKTRLRRLWRRSNLPVEGGATQAASPAASARVSRREVASADPAAAVLEAAATRYDMLFAGASRGGNLIGGEFLKEVVVGAECHVVIVKAGKERREVHNHILVATDGSAVSRMAVEFAVRYAEAVSGSLTVAVLMEQREQAAVYAGSPGTPREITAVRAEEDTIPEHISPVFLTSPVRPKVVSLTYDTDSSAVLRHLREERYDLLVIGAENRSVRNHLFFGYENERLATWSEITSVILVPRTAVG